MDISPDSETTVSRGETIKQFSVFMENRVGKLAEMVRLMHNAGVTILGLSIIDTADCAIDRMIVDDPDAARNVLNEHGIAFTETAVVIAEMQGADDLIKVAATLLQAECNIHFAYSLLTQPNGRPCLVVNVDDDECARTVMTQAGIRVLGQGDLSR